MKLVGDEKKKTRSTSNSILRINAAGVRFCRLPAGFYGVEEYVPFKVAARSDSILRLRRHTLPTLDLGQQEVIGGALGKQGNRFFKFILSAAQLTLLQIKMAQLLMNLRISMRDGGRLQEQWERFAGAVSMNEDYGEIQQGLFAGVIRRLLPGNCPAVLLNCVVRSIQTFIGESEIISRLYTAG